MVLLQIKSNVMIDFAMNIDFGEERRKEEDERMLGTAQLTALNTSFYTILVSFS